MGTLFNKYKTYLLVVVGVVVVIGVWWSFSSDAPSNSLLTTQGASNSTGGDKDLVDTLLQLRTVSLSGTIFSDPSFARLQDFATPIVPEPIGRPNPFAPLTYRATTTEESGSLFTPLTF
jgi:hypothetical protein